MIAQVYSDDNIEVYRFLSTDEKPLSCKHGSRALEIDTGRKYIFNAENSIWQEVHDSDEDRPVDTYTKEETQALLLTKVDKVSGMGLSQESYTTVEKQKLAGIEAGATAVTVDSALSSTSTNPVQNQAVYADKQKQDAALAEVENKGAKNLFKITAVSEVKQGVRFTINSDGTVTVTRESAGTSNAFLTLGLFTGEPGVTYTLSGCPATGSDSTYYMYIGSTFRDYGSGVSREGGTERGIVIYVDKTYSPDNLVFKPMLCTKAEWDISHTYVSYGKTNAELTAEKTDIIDVYGRGIEIPENADLHTYTTPGVYYSPSSARSATLSNCPTTQAGFRLVVTEETTIDGSRVRHDLYSVGSTSSGIYSENLGGTTLTYPDGWRPWVLFGPITTDPDSTNAMNFMSPSAKKFYDDQQRQETEIGVVANAGAKNFAVPFDPTPATDISITKNADGSITFVCANVAENRVIRVANIRDVPSGAYTFSGTTGGSSSTYMLGLYNTSASAVKYQHTNAEETYTGNVSGFSLRVRVISGYSGTFTVYPMIRPAAITDQTFQPYALSNPVITPAAIKAVDEGEKNFVQLGFTSTSGSSSVPATTNNNDGTITVNGSRVGNATILVQDLITAQTSIVNTRYTLPAGNYVIAPTGNANIGLQVYKHDGTNQVGLGNARLEALSFTYSDTDKVQYPYICIRLYCEGNVTINNYTFMPMVCTAADYAVSPKSVPYAPTNRELYEEKIGIEDVFGSGTQILTNGTADITEIGNFYCSNADTAATVINAPWTDSGFFGFVRRSVLPSERFIQIAFKNNDTMAIAKRRYTGTWQPWAYSSSEPRSVGNYIMSYADSLPTPGVYFAYHIAGSGIDKPVAGHRYMYQIMMMSSTYGCIHAYELDPSSGAVMYIANKINGTWSSWYKIEGAPLT